MPIRTQVSPTYDCLDQILRRADLAKGNLEVISIVEGFQEFFMEWVDVLNKICQQYPAYGVCFSTYLETWERLENRGEFGSELIRSSVR